MKNTIIALLLAVLPALAKGQEEHKRLTHEEKVQRDIKARRAEKEKEIETAIEKFKYPVDSVWHVCYHKAMPVAKGKSFLYKRVMQFVAVENFDKTETITCRDRGVISTRIFDNPVIYKDEEEGKIFGNGYFRFCWVNKENYIVTFKYKVQVKDSLYMYDFYDFNVIEFVSPEKTKTKGGSTGVAVYGSTFSSSSATATFNAANLVSTPLEEFMLDDNYYRTSHDKFKTEIRRVINELKSTINESF